MRDLLNRRHDDGRPSNRLHAAGVLVHMLDGGIAPNKLWEGGPRGFLSASLLNGKKRPHGLYHGGIGIVVSPASRLQCCYPQDSGTKSWVGNKAVVGYQGCGPAMCTPDGLADGTPFPMPTHDHGYPCAFPALMLQQCLEVFDAYDTQVSAYTEVVVDVSSTTAYAIDAVVGIGGVDAHRALLQRWGLNERQVPLLVFGPGLKGDGMLFEDPPASALHTAGR